MAKLPRQVEELIVEIMTKDEPIFLPQRCENFATGLADAGYMIVPIKPTEKMLDELGHIGDGPMISGEEVWGYMLAAAGADNV